MYVSSRSSSPLYTLSVFTDLSKKIPTNLLDPSLLEAVYIPNLVASPFTVNKADAVLIYNCRSLPHLLKVLRKRAAPPMAQHNRGTSKRT